MSNVIEPGYVVPTPQPVKTVGLLNVVFASLLLMLSLVSIVSNLMMPWSLKVMQAQQRQTIESLQAKADAGARQALEDLKEEEKTATTAEQKAQIKVRRTRLQNRPKPFIPDTTSMVMNIARHPLVRKYQRIDYATGIPLNLALLASGIALLRLKRWGRSLANGVAVLKILRAVGLMIVAVLLISPMLTKMIGGAFDEIGRQTAAQQGGNPANAAKVQQIMRWMTRIMGAVMTGFYVIYFLVAMIYHAVLLFVLNKPGARAALVAQPANPGGIVS